MYRKLTVLLLFVSLLISHFMFSSAPASQAAPSADMAELVSLLPDPDAVITIDVKRILTETAPEILNQRESSLAKVRKTMQSIADQVGVDPYEINQLAFGVKLSEMSKNVKDPDFEPLLVMRTEKPADAIAEKIYQTMVINNQFDREKNPTKDLISRLKTRIAADTFEFTDEELKNLISRYDQFAEKIKAVQTSLAAVPKTPASNVSLATLNKSASGMTQSVSYLSNLLKNNSSIKDYQTAIGKLETRLDSIPVSDAQRAIKIKAITDEASKLEKDSVVKLNDFRKSTELISTERDTPLSDEELTTVREALDSLPTTEPKKAQSLKKIQTLMGDIQNLLNAKTKAVDDMAEQKAQIVADVEKEVQQSSSDVKPREISKNEEKVGNRRMIIINDTSNRVFTDVAATEKPADGLVLGIYDDHTLLVTLGKDNVAKTLAIQTVDTSRNKGVKDILAKSGNSLIAFAVDLKNMNFDKGDDKGFYRQFERYFGNQLNTWQVFGSVNSVSNDVTMSLGAARSESAKSSVAEEEKADADDSTSNLNVGSFFLPVELLKTLRNSVIGMQLQMTVKFEKKKIAQLVKQSPKIIEALTSKKTTKSENKTIANNENQKPKPIMEAFTSPQAYIDLIHLFTE